MKVVSINGTEEINEVLMVAMAATVEGIVARGLITRDQAACFLDEHVCMMAGGGGGFKSWLARVFPGMTESTARVVIAQIQKPTDGDKPAKPE